ALVLKPPLGMNLAALWHQQSSALQQTRSLTSPGDLSRRTLLKLHNLAVNLALKIKRQA
nr:hypothetical protein [Tanacetum cinerariifolium]